MRKFKWVLEGIVLVVFLAFGVDVLINPDVYFGAKNASHQEVPNQVDAVTETSDEARAGSVSSQSSQLRETSVNNESRSTTSPFNIQDSTVHDSLTTNRMGWGTEDVQGEQQSSLGEKQTLGTPQEESKRRFEEMKKKLEEQERERLGKLVQTQESMKKKEEMINAQVIQHRNAQKAAAEKEAQGREMQIMQSRQAYQGELNRNQQEAIRNEKDFQNAMKAVNKDMDSQYQQTHPYTIRGTPGSPQWSSDIRNMDIRR